MLGYCDWGAAARRALACINDDCSVCCSCEKNLAPL